MDALFEREVDFSEDVHSVSSFQSSVHTNTTHEAFKPPTSKEKKKNKEFKLCEYKHFKSLMDARGEAHDNFVVVPYNSDPEAIKDLGQLLNKISDTLNVDGTRCSAEVHYTNLNFNGKCVNLM